MLPRPAYEMKKALWRLLLESDLLRRTGVYAVSNGIGPALGFLSLPVFTRFLDPASYGIAAMFLTVVGILVPLMGLSVHGAIRRQYFGLPADTFRNYVFNCTLILAVSATLAGLLLWVFADGVAELSGVPATWLWAAWAVATASFVNRVVLTLWQIRGQAVPYATFQASFAVVKTGLSILLVVAAGLQWRGKIIGHLGGTLTFACLGMYILSTKGYLRGRAEIPALKHALSFGIPLVPHAFGIWAITLTDRILITNLLGLRPVGIYAAAANVALLVVLLEDAFILAWVPHFFEMMNRQSAKVRNRIVRISYAYFGVLFGVALLLGTIAPWVASWLLGDAYREAARYILWLALAYAFHGMSKMVVAYFHYIHKTATPAFVIALTALLNLVVSYFLIRRYGAVGACYGTLIAHALAFAFVWALAARQVRMPWIIRERT